MPFTPRTFSFLDGFIITLNAALMNPSQASIDIETLRSKVTALKELLKEEPNQTRSFGTFTDSLNTIEHSIIQLQRSMGDNTRAGFSTRREVVRSLTTFAHLQVRYFTESSKTFQDFEAKLLQVLERKIRGGTQPVDMAPRQAQVHGGPSQQGVRPTPTPSEFSYDPSTQDDAASFSSSQNRPYSSHYAHAPQGVASFSNQDYAYYGPQYYGDSSNPSIQSYDVGDTASFSNASHNSSLRNAHAPQGVASSSNQGYAYNPYYYPQYHAGSSSNPYNQG